ncbi:MAG TPA: HAD-IIIA family hydrolase, partial [Thermodesulforhabdus norvegica]|nr:HAD-IIIA family hydrolase [Thermodesulforhabdus norvegica]
VKKVEEFCLFPDVIPALRLAKKQGYSLIVVSNQSGIGRGIINIGNFWRIHFFLVQLLQKNGIFLTGALYCPHRPEQNCRCRKPEPGMLVRAADIFSFSLPGSIFIGDRKTDVEAAQKAECRPVLVLREKVAYFDSTYEYPIYESLMDAVANECIRKET